MLMRQRSPVRVQWSSSAAARSWVRAIVPGGVSRWESTFRTRGDAETSHTENDHSRPFQRAMVGSRQCTSTTQ
jgi:hypothetical protein